MAPRVISPEREEELRRLHDELAKANARAAKARMTDPPGQILEGKALAHVEEENANIAAILRQIKEIQGEYEG
jgi:hypothetical protein